jgi:nicotinamidase/pyrazinamidase
MTEVLLVIDVQNDFCPGGALAVAGGHDVVAVINQIAQGFNHVVLTQDWHPAAHSSFASSHPGSSPFSQITMPYGPQTLWPDHCIIGSPGAEFHPLLDLPRAELIVRKGFRPEIDSYSAFFENDHRTPTGLGGYLRERGFTAVTCVGLAFDYCVRYSAEDAKALGFTTRVIERATRAIDLGGTAAATRQSFTERGIDLL